MNGITITIVTSIAIAIRIAIATGHRVCGLNLPQVTG